MSKPKTRIIRFDEKTHEPEYIGIETPLEDGGAIIENIYGKPKYIIIPNKCDECELFKEGICNHTHENNCKYHLFPFLNKEEEKQ